MDKGHHSFIVKSSQQTKNRKKLLHPGKRYQGKKPYTRYHTGSKALKDFPSVGAQQERLLSSQLFKVSLQVSAPPPKKKKEIEKA